MCIRDRWSASKSDSLAGALWRLYVVREWIHADPVRAARAYDAGQSTAQVARAIAGSPIRQVLTSCAP